MTPLNNVKTLSPPRPSSRRLAGVMFLLSLSLLAGMIWLLLAGCHYYLPNPPFSPAIILGPLAWGLLGLLIVFYRPNNRIGWLCLLASVTAPVFDFTDMYATCGTQGILSLPGVAYAAWISFSLPILGGGVMAILVPQLYPNGRFLSIRWRRLVVSLLIIHFTATLAVGLLPDFNQDNGFGVSRFPVKNPFGFAYLPAWWQLIFSQTSFLTTIALVIIGIISIIVRFRRSTGDERQQIKWLAYFLGTAVAVQIVFFELLGTLFYPQIFETLLYQFIVHITYLGFPVTIGIAIFKYRLFDIDRIINRTLVYGALTLLITAVYVFLVGGIGTLAANQSGQVIGLAMATVIVLVAIRPLHHSWQATVNRFVAVPVSPPNGGFNGEQTIGATEALPPPSPPLLGGGAINTSLPAEGVATKTPPPAGGNEGGSVPRSRWLAAALFLVALTSQFGLGWLTAVDCTRFSDYGSVGLLVSAASGLAFALVGGLILFFRSHNRVGWLCLVTGFGLPTLAAIDIYVSCGLAGHLAAPGLAYLAWFVYSFGSIILIIVPMFILLPMLYPNGQFLSARWRWLTIVSFIVLGIASLAMGLLPDFNRQNAIDHFFPVNNPFGLAYLPDWWYSFFYSTSSLAIFFLSFTGITAMVVRLKRSVGDERQQMKWLAYFLATAVVVQLLGFELPGAFFYPQIFDTIWYELIILVVFLGFPSIIGLAVFKYRLYAIDVVINRTLVYGGLTLVVVLIYTLTVSGLSLLFHTTGNLPISLIATALIAIAFQPARDRLQRGVNRFMFGQRDDPYAVLSHLSQKLQTTAVPTETLTSTVETIAATLKLPYAAIELVEQEEQIGQASVGEPVGEIVELPLRYHKETIGRLMVSPRAPGEKFTVKEQQLLADIAGQTGAVASATRLTLALQRSREKLVLAREEERRRIRRDLHDGLGPTLASQTLKLDAILELLDEDPQAAIEQVQTLKQQTQRMVVDIRRLVYELRPPALDELGLLEALRAHFAQIGGDNGRLYISIEASPELLPTLPAAIEVAAYRIALEGVTNVIRHAQARNCQVRFAITAGQPLPGLVITITDDGQGLPVKFQAGVGLASMRERAEELGGVCIVGEAQNRGTQIRAVLPFSASQNSKR